MKDLLHVLKIFYVRFSLVDTTSLIKQLRKVIIRSAMSCLSVRVDKGDCKRVVYREIYFDVEYIYGFVGGVCRKKYDVTVRLRSNMATMCNCGNVTSTTRWRMLLWQRHVNG
jgi:uncharacterized Fe-S cluster-containing radical SAM superfamily enzyme